MLAQAASRFALTSLLTMTTVIAHNHSPQTQKGGLPMDGVIRTREKCAYCGGKFKDGFIGKTPDLVCPCGRTPRNYYIYIYAPSPGENPDRKIYEYKTNRFQSYEFTSRILTQIRNEIHDRIFDIHDYLPKSLAQFSPRKLIVKYYKSRCRKRLRPTTRKDLRGHIRNYFSPGAQRLKINDCREIRAHHIEDFFNNLPGTITLKTKDNIMTNLHGFMTWLYHREVIERRPMFPTISVPKPAAKWASLEYLMQAFPFVPDRDKPVIHFILHHPPRSSEVCALLVEDFMLDKWVVYVSKAFSKGEVWERKNNKPYYCPLSEKFDKSVLKGKFPKAYAFTNRIGNHYTANSLKKIWGRACNKARIEYIPLKYAGRTRIASDAANRGESLYHIAGALGNTPEVVASNYAHLQVESLRNVIDIKEGK